MIGKLLDHYRILAEIGHGGMGIVYRAHDEVLDRDVAVKVLAAGTGNWRKAAQQSIPRARTSNAEGRANHLWALRFIFQGRCGSSPTDVPRWHFQPGLQLFAMPSISSALFIPASATVC